MGPRGCFPEPSEGHRICVKIYIAHKSKKSKPSHQKCNFKPSRGAPKPAPRPLKKVSKTARLKNVMLASLVFSARFGLLLKIKNKRFVWEGCDFQASRRLASYHPRGDFNRLRNDFKSARAYNHKVEKCTPSHAKCPFRASQDGPKTIRSRFQVAFKDSFVLTFCTVS